MIKSIIDFSIRNKLIIGLFTMILIILGIYSLTQLPVDAVPDVTNNQVQVISIAPTLATQEVEKFISAPIEVAVSTIPDIIELRSISRLGLSVVTIVFRDEVDIYKARQQISERLKDAEAQIPPGVTQPELAPVSSGLGEIYQYLVKPKPGFESKYTSTDLRTVQDWIVKRELLGTPGVAEVNSYGGFVKEYEVAVNPERLNSMNITLSEIFEALEKNNENTGSAYIEKEHNSYFIRGIGLLNGFDDIGKIVIKTNPDHVPVLIRDVADVHEGHAIRYGAFVADTSEAVGGVVMMLKGANASRVIADVKERMKTIETSLPEGIMIEVFLDRTDLVERAIGTVTKNLLEGGLIVVLVLVLALGNLRAGLVVASVIPLSMLFAISMMNLFGISGNLMSLGAIDFGLIVDGAVIIVENVVHRISQISKKRFNNTPLTSSEMDFEVGSASKSMMSSATFGQIIILIVYLPILSLVGIEGKMFRPMAQTVGFAILGALILSLTYVPVASALFLPKKTSGKKSFADHFMTGIHRIFDPMIRFSLGHKITILTVSILLFAGSILIFSRLGGEFIPNLEEGDLASGIMTLQGGSLTNTVETVKKANKILLDNFPEVKHAVCKVGAGEIPTDPTPVETGDYIITMKDKKDWVTAKTREEMVEKMKEKTSAIPGVEFSFQQPIQMRFNELMTGSKQDVAIKVFGDNLDSLAVEAEKIAGLIATLDGVEDVQVDKVTGSPQISVIYNREKIARYGLNIADVNKILRTAFAGSTAGVIFEEEKRFDLVVRFEEPFRQDIENVKRLYIPLNDGRQIPLEELATIELKNGTAQVSREDARRRITVGFNVRGRDVQSIIADCKKMISSDVQLPPGYFVTYGGQFENLVEAQQRLSIAVPVALVLIFVLLFFAFHSVGQTLLIFTAVPLSAIGGVIALYLRGMNFSISAGIGFIALFGVAVLNGIVLIAEFNRLKKEEGMIDIYERVLKGLKIRLRPIIITAAVASLGFLPMAMSTSAGAEVQKPLATVVIGGLISSTLLTIMVLPVLYILFDRKRRPGKVTPKTIGVLLMMLLFLLISSSEVMAQEKPAKVYTLEMAIQQALKNNGIAKSAALEVQNQKALRKTAWEVDRTNIGLSYGQINSPEKDNEFSISQGIAFPSTYFLKDKLAKKEILNAELQEQVTNNEIISQVKSIYFEISYLRAVLNLLEYQDSLVANFAHSAQLRFNRGESTILEKMTAESQQLIVRNQIQQNIADIHIRSCMLQVLLNEDKDIEIADTVLQKLTLNVPAGDFAAGANPFVSLNELQPEMAHLKGRVVKAGLLPDLSLGYFNQSMAGISGERFDGIQGGISIPLIFPSQTAKIRSARITEEIAKETLGYQMSTFKHKQHILTQEYEKYRNSLEYFENAALRQGAMIIDQAGKSYKAGEIDYTEYVQNLRQGMEIRTSYLTTLNAYNQSVIALESFYFTNK